MSKLVGRIIEALEVRWKSFDIPPTEEGMYVVAVFNEAGILEAYEDDWVYVKQFSNKPVSNHSGTRLRSAPTHYMTLKDFDQLLGLIPKENKDKEVIL